jgi:hypothetical protein
MTTIPENPNIQNQATGASSACLQHKKLSFALYSWQVRQARSSIATVDIAVDDKDHRDEFLSHWHFQFVNLNCRTRVFSSINRVPASEICPSTV